MRGDEEVVSASFLNTGSDMDDQNRRYEQVETVPWRNYSDRIADCPIRGKGSVEKTTSTGTSKNPAIRNAR